MLLYDCLESILVTVGFPPKYAVKDVHKKSKPFCKWIVPIFYTLSIW